MKHNEDVRLRVHEELLFVAPFLFLKEKKGSSALISFITSPPKDEEDQCSACSSRTMFFVFCQIKNGD